MIHYYLLLYNKLPGSLLHAENLFPVTRLWLSSLQCSNIVILECIDIFLHPYQMVLWAEHWVRWCRQTERGCCIRNCWEILKSLIIIIIIIIEIKQRAQILFPTSSLTTSGRVCRCCRLHSPTGCEPEGRNRKMMKIHLLRFSENTNSHPFLMSTFTRAASPYTFNWLVTCTFQRFPLTHSHLFHKILKARLLFINIHWNIQQQSASITAINNFILLLKAFKKS